MRPIAYSLSVMSNYLGRVPRPSWLTYLVTYRCNARCGMCDSWRMKPGPELTPEQAERVFAKIGRLDVIRLSGGEPFLRPDLPQIAEAALTACRPLVLHITTNGSFPERVVDFARHCSRPERLRFMVSFDGLEAEHDASRGAEVTFEKAFETARRLSELRGALRLEVSANHTVISPASLADHDRLCERLATIGVEPHVVLAYADSAMYSVKLRGKRADHLIVPRGYPLHPRLRGADVAAFVARLQQRVGQFRDPMLRLAKRYYLRGLSQRLAHAARARPNPRCVALRSHIRLLPDGGVPVCQFNTERVGNLLEQSLEEVWRGPSARESRAWVDACPGCWAECEVMPSALYSGDLLRELLPTLLHGYNPALTHRSGGHDEDRTQPLDAT